MARVAKAAERSSSKTRVMRISVGWRSRQDNPSAVGRGARGDEAPQRANAESGTHVDQSSSIDAAARPRCLIVDDEPRLRQVLARLMRGDGFDCDEAGSGVEALEALERTPVPLLLTDLRMPRMDGL